MEFLSFPNQDLSYPGKKHIPPEYADSLLPESEKAYLAKSYGHIFTQGIRHPDVEIWQHDFFTNRLTQVEPFVTRGILTLHFMLMGSIDFFLRGEGKGTMQEGWYILFYVSAGKGHKAWLPKGHSRSFHLDISIALLEELAGRFSELQPLLQHAKERMSEGIHQGPVQVDKSVIQILEEFYKVPANDTAQPFYMAAIRILLLFYARDISGYARQPFVSGRFTFTSEDIDKLTGPKTWPLRLRKDLPSPLTFFREKWP